MLCFVYRSRPQYDMYLYVIEKDNFENIPEALMKKFGMPEFSLDFELTPERNLARADTAEVIKSLESTGYYLQMPDKMAILNPIDTKFS
jgi:uncharacterized protein YcgL (UPF0745 family)